MRNCRPRLRGGMRTRLSRLFVSWFDDNLEVGKMGCLSRLLTAYNPNYIYTASTVLGSYWLFLKCLVNDNLSFIMSKRSKKEVGTLFDSKYVEWPHFTWPFLLDRSGRKYPQRLLVVMLGQKVEIAGVKS